MAATPKKSKPTKPAYTDYYTFPGPFSLNTKGDKNPRKGMAKPKSTPKPKKSGTNPGM